MSAMSVVPTEESSRLTISAATLQAAERRALAVPSRWPANCFSIISSSSASAEGCTPSSVATRITRSERSASGRQRQHFGRLVGIEIREHDGDDLRVLVAHQLGHLRARPST